MDASEDRWQALARVVPVGPPASVCILTLTKPEPAPADAFEEGMRPMDDELGTLKSVLKR